MRVELGQTVLWFGKIVSITRRGPKEHHRCQTVSHSDYKAELYGGDGIAMTEFHFKNLLWNPDRQLWEFVGNSVDRPFRYSPEYGE